MIRTISIAFVVFAGSACFADDSIRAQIDARNLEWTNAFNRGDIEAVSAIYDEGFIAVPPASKHVTDRTDLQSIFAAMLPVGKNLQFTTLSLDVVGDYAYELGQSSYSLKDESGVWNPAGDKYLVVWRKGADGVWYYHIDIWWPSS